MTNFQAVTRRGWIAGASAAAGTVLVSAAAAPTSTIPLQPYFAAVQRALDAMAKLGFPLLADDRTRLDNLARQADQDALAATESILERYTLIKLSADRGRRIQTKPGGAPPVLVEQGWRVFLLRVENSGGLTDAFDILTSPPGMPPGHMDRWIAAGGYSMSQHPPVVDSVNYAGWISQSWCLARLSDTSPLTGMPLEYRILEVFSRDSGTRGTTPSFVIGPATRRGHEIAFQCLPSRTISLGIRDTDQKGCVASLIIRDESGRYYPPQLMRIAPDLPFQKQIYRGDGETIVLPDGTYTIQSWRGPEYLRSILHYRAGAAPARIDIALQRWIDPTKWGWYSGDTHIHAAGCAHYDVPSQGVSPETMIRHVRGEALSIAEVLTWGPGYEYQKQFFSGHAISPHATLEHPDLQKANNVTLQTRDTPKDGESLIRYDLEISRFPSSHAGHLVLLRVSDQKYPGANFIEDWPSWNLPILKWARAQGAAVGYAHCGGGMDVDSQALPNYLIPLFDGLGTNEAIVDVTHGMVDFLSGCDLTPVGELNAWYHMLNCGFRLAMVGETDFPCITDERPGTGRSYVRLDRPPSDDRGYQDWIEAMKRGRLYCGDGRSHFLEFSVNGLSSGEADVVLAAPGKVQVNALVAARLEPAPTDETRAIRSDHQSWHIEHARIGDSREVAVEIVVNGEAVDSVKILADGTPRPIHVTAQVAQSSWVALRIMPSGHTHPIFVSVGGKPVRASGRSARWCRDCVDKLWQVKSPFMRPAEIAAARVAFDHARAAYEEIERQCSAQ